MENFFCSFLLLISSARQRKAKIKNAPSNQKTTKSEIFAFSFECKNVFYPIFYDQREAFFNHFTMAYNCGFFTRSIRGAYLMLRFYWNHFEKVFVKTLYWWSTTEPSHRKIRQHLAEIYWSLNFYQTKTHCPELEGKKVSLALMWRNFFSSICGSRHSFASSHARTRHIKPWTCVESEHFMFDLKRYGTFT